MGGGCDFCSHGQVSTFSQLSFPSRTLLFYHSCIHVSPCKYVDITSQGVKRSALPSLLLWFLHFQLLRCLPLSLHTLLQRRHFPTRDAESVFPEGRQEDCQSPLGLEAYWKITVFLVSQNAYGLRVGVGVSVWERKSMRKRKRNLTVLQHCSAFNVT